MLRNISIAFRPVDTLSAKQLEEMYRLYCHSYQMTRQEFDNKLTHRLDVIACFHLRSTKQLVGYCGLAEHQFQLSDSTNAIGIYMGLSVIDAEHRGKNLIQRTITEQYLRLRLKYPFRPIYAWLNALSVKTFLASAGNLEHFWPHHQRSTPKKVTELRDMIGARYYPNDYNKKKGIIKKPKQTVMSAELHIDKHRLAEPLVQFYVASNPGYTKGDGLLILVPCSAENLFFWLRKKSRAIYAKALKGLPLT